MIPNINFDTILSDPMLLIATVLMVLGPLVFLFSLIKFLFAKKSAPVIPNFHDEEVEPEPAPEPQPEPEPELTAPASAYETIPEPEVEPEAVKNGASIPVQHSDPEPASDKTVIMPAGMGEVQGQIEIVFSQIKTLNKKVYEIESEIESLSRTAANKLDVNELKEPPMNPADFTQKLLKLAEHVIVLEKEVARLKTSGSQPAIAQTAGKPPIMPI